jgi:hypothetical protein
MKGEKILDKDHIARYCAPKTIHDGEIQPSAFVLRESDESLSVNWLEYLNRSIRESEIAEIQKVYSAKLHVRAKAKIAILNVGEVREKVLIKSSDRRNLEVLHAPSTHDLSHSGIYNLKQDNELIAELIIQTVRETYPARK